MRFWRAVTLLGCAWGLWVGHGQPIDCSFTPEDTECLRVEYRWEPPQYFDQKLQCEQAIRSQGYKYVNKQKHWVMVNKEGQEVTAKCVPDGVKPWE